MIQFDQVSKRYLGGHEALRNLSFRVDRGEMVFVTGHSGAGKSTLIKLITAVEKPSVGQVRVADILLNQIKASQIPYFRRTLGVVHQSHELLFDRSVYDNIALPLIISGMSKKDRDRRIRAAADKVGLSERLDYLPVMLSGGEQQRVGIARAVVNKPQMIIADEPTGNLDPQLSREIMQLFIQFNRVGTTVLVVSHDLGMLSRLPYRILTLRQGQLLQAPAGQVPGRPMSSSPMPVSPSPRGPYG